MNNVATVFVGFRQSETQTSLLNYIEELEIGNSTVSKSRYDAFQKASKKVLIRLRSYTYPSWSAPLFFANPENRFSRAEDQIVVYHVVLFGVVFYVLNLFHRFQMKRLSMHIKKNV